MRFGDGNLGRTCIGAERKDPRDCGPKRLLEECEVVAVHVVQHRFGKRLLIDAIRQARPFRLPVLGGSFDVWLGYEIHRLPGKWERWSSLEDGTARLWFICPQCRRKARKLYYFYIPGSRALSDLLCRWCHRLTTQAANCGGNRWYRETAVPIKKLIRERSKLASRRQSARVRARLEQIRAEILALQQTVLPKTKSAWRKMLSTRRVKRPYRDVRLVG